MANPSPVPIQVDSAESGDQEEMTDLVNVLKTREEYYQTHSKNMIFKKRQKQDCAEVVCKQYGLETLMNRTFWIVPNHNQLFYEYRFFKLYGTPDNYSIIVENVLSLCTWCVSQYSTFELHVNLASFTMSAAERYKNLIIIFCDECLRRETHFTESLDFMYLYNIPTVFDNISRLLLPLIPPEVRPKIRLVKKEDSTEPLTRIYANSGKIYTP